VVSVFMMVCDQWKKRKRMSKKLLFIFRLSLFLSFYSYVISADFDYTSNLKYACELIVQGKCEKGDELLRPFINDTENPLQNKYKRLCDRYTSFSQRFFSYFPGMFNEAFAGASFSVVLMNSFQKAESPSLSVLFFSLMLFASGKAVKTLEGWWYSYMQAAQDILDDLES